MKTNSELKEKLALYWLKKRLVFLVLWKKLKREIPMLWGEQLERFYGFKQAVCQ
ncbi:MULTISPECIES: hypothetical protein [unclassified Wolbachia]|uniref:hypothetical protein n=1 Tax=unclassified Wolbachia TaxID=2640676 RepID=UPI00221F7B8D|nr:MULTISPECIES: hypothetical protein [unclassified Wolbachia]